MGERSTSSTAGFAEAWQVLNPAFRRSLELAYESLAEGGLAVGGVLTDADHQVIAEGRNRAYDAPGGRDALQRTPLAHAEMNVLAAVHTGWDLADCILWSTQEPCAMCAAAASFTGVGRVRYLAPDPWALATQAPGSTPAPSAVGARSTGPADDLWVVSANMLFLLSIAHRSGVAHPTIVRNRVLEPETTGIVMDLVAEDLAGPVLTRERSLTVALSAVWDRIVTAATARTQRTTP